MLASGAVDISMVMPGFSAWNLSIAVFRAGAAVAEESSVSVTSSAAAGAADIAEARSANAPTVAASLVSFIVSSNVFA
jgi:hypothetical protein